MSDDEKDRAATSNAFDALHYIARKRLTASKITVVDDREIVACGDEGGNAGS